MKRKNPENDEDLLQRKQEDRDQEEEMLPQNLYLGQEKKIDHDNNNNNYQPAMNKNNGQQNMDQIAQPFANNKLDQNQNINNHIDANKVDLKFEIWLLNNLQDPSRWEIPIIEKDKDREVSGGFDFKIKCEFKAQYSVFAPVHIILNLENLLSEEQARLIREIHYNITYYDYEKKSYSDKPISAKTSDFFVKEVLKYVLQLGGSFIRSDDFLRSLRSTQKIFAPANNQKEGSQTFQRKGKLVFGKYAAKKITRESPLLKFLTFLKGKMPDYLVNLQNAKAQNEANIPAPEVEHLQQLLNNNVEQQQQQQQAKLQQQQEQRQQQQQAQLQQQQQQQQQAQLQQQILQLQQQQLQQQMKQHQQYLLLQPMQQQQMLQQMQNLKEKQQHLGQMQNDGQRDWKYDPENAQNATPDEEKLYVKIREKVLKLFEQPEQISLDVLERVLVNIEDVETLHKNNVEICKELFNHKQLQSRKYPGVVLHGEQDDANLELRAKSLYLTLLSVWEALIEANKEGLFIDFFINAFISKDHQACLEGRFRAIDNWYQKNKHQLKKVSLSSEENINYKTIQDNVVEQAQITYKKFAAETKEGIQLMLFSNDSAEYQAQKNELKIALENAPDGSDNKAKIGARLANVQTFIEFIQSQQIKIANQLETKELYNEMLEEVKSALLDKQAKDGQITLEKIIEILEIQLCWEF